MSGDGDVDGWKKTGGDPCGSHQVRYPGVVAVARALERWCGLGAGERPCPGVVGVTSGYQICSIRLECGVFISA